jgi:dynactin 1
LAETYFKAFDFDLGERELGLVLSLDHDLDVYASSMGLTKTAVEAILNDEGVLFLACSCLADSTAILDVARDLDGMEPEKSFLEPIQKSLDQCKNAKSVARWGRLHHRREVINLYLQEIDETVGRTCP